MKRKIVRAMKALGTYKKEFEPMIEIFAGMLEQYGELSGQYEEMGKPVTDEEGKKPPIVTQIETLRKDILNYSDRLMLNPKALQIDSASENKGSKLDVFLEKIGGQEK